MISNRIVTKGLSRNTKNLLVTRGFIPGFIQEVIEISKQVIRYGGSAARKVYDRLEEIVVFAKLTKVNNKEQDGTIKGWVRITYNRSRQIVVNAMKTTYAAIKSNISEIVISIKRIKP